MINAIGAAHRDMRWDKRPDEWTNVRIEAAKQRLKLGLGNNEKQPPHPGRSERGWYA
jgi:hypothetical protein